MEIKMHCYRITYRYEITAEDDPDCPGTYLSEMSFRAISEEAALQMFFAVPSFHLYRSLIEIKQLY